MNPFDQAAEDAAMRLRVGFARANLEKQLADWRDRNYAIRVNPEIPPSVTVEVPARLVREGEDLAEVQVCEVDSWTLVEVGAGPDGSDAIVSPDVLTYRTAFLLRLVEGRWKIEGGDEIARWEGARSCDDA